MRNPGELLSSKDLLQDVCCPFERIFPDCGLFLGQVVKDSGDSLVYNMLLQVGLNVGNKRQAGILTHRRIIRLTRADLVKRVLDDRSIDCVSIASCRAGSDTVAMTPA